jgi:prepilin-type N-terminal cleavage/methylation domain-containing protein
MRVYGASADGVPSRKAFTLFELVLVLALLVVMTALAYPSIDSMYGTYRVQAAVDMVRAAWAAARSRAIDEGQPYRFAIIPGEGKFRVAPDSGNYWNGSGGPAAEADSGVRPYIQEDTLPKGVRFDMPEAPADSGSASPEAGGSGAWNTVATFLPDGSAKEDVAIQFVGRGGGRALVLKLRGLTGVVRLESSKGGGGP